MPALGSAARERFATLENPMILEQLSAPVSQENDMRTFAKLAPVLPEPLRFAPPDAQSPSASSSAARGGEMIDGTIRQSSGQGRRAAGEAASAACQLTMAHAVAEKWIGRYGNLCSTPRKRGA